MVGAPVGPLLLAADAVVEGVHADPGLTDLADLGWRALAACASDVAAMGGRPSAALVTVTVPPDRDGGRLLDQLYDGIEAASAALGCPVVGGDLTAGPGLVVAVAVTGTLDGGSEGPVLRSGARPGDTLLVTAALGAAAAGLRLLRAGTPELGPALVVAHRRPVARVAEGRAARTGGATAMIDLSDGLAADLRGLAAASGVGVVVDEVPVAAGATAEEALVGGDDHELLVAAPDPAAVAASFAAAGLAQPVPIGRCTGDPAEVRLGDGDLPEGGWEHSW